MKLSVIIPGYNTSQFEWERCIQSVKCAIDFAKCEAEIICVDDGSKDGATFLDCRDDIIVLHQANQGPSVARNAGLAIAKGDWISFVDSDDILHKEVYQHAFSQLQETGSDIVVFGVETIWPSIKIKKDDSISTMNLGALSPKYLCLLRDKNLLNYVWNKIYKHSFLTMSNISFPLDAIMGEDLIFNLQCAINGAKWSTIDVIGYTYYRTTSTLLSRYKPKYISGLLCTNQIWQAYNSFAIKFANESTTSISTLTDVQLERLEWRNIWMPKSPYHLIGKWKWLRQHPRVGGMLEFVRMFIYTFLRRFFYFSWVRKRHIKRLYPYAKDME